MAKEGSGSHMYDAGGPLDSQFLRYAVNDVSKVHDWFNSWNYSKTGQYMSRGTTFDSAFQIYSFSGMPVAAVMTFVGKVGNTKFSEQMRSQKNRDN